MKPKLQQDGFRRTGKGQPDFREKPAISLVSPPIALAKKIQWLLLTKYLVDVGLGEQQLSNFSSSVDLDFHHSTTIRSNMYSNVSQQQP